ncbi:MAG: hypothetical protein HY815_22555 [Candidatus Riflebacteria bacterium]|nr:hypothetical protein [Candidatus Riflebacteria bacterium]
MRPGSCGTTLVEMMVAAAAALVLLIVLMFVLVGSMQGFSRGQDALTNAQNLLVLEGHLRSDLQSVDGHYADLASTISAGQSWLSLVTRRTDRFEIVKYELDAATRALVRTQGSDRKVLGKGYITAFTAQAEADVIDALGVISTVQLPVIATRYPLKIRIRVQVGVYAADEASGKTRAEPRTLKMLSTPVRLNRRLRAYWAQEFKKPPSLSSTTSSTAPLVPDKTGTK